MGRRGSTKYRDYYFLAQYEAGQPELVQLHHYTYEVRARARARARVSYGSSLTPKPTPNP